MYLRRWENEGIGTRRDGDHNPLDGGDAQAEGSSHYVALGGCTSGRKLARCRSVLKKIISTNRLGFIKCAKALSM
jgi:hypothetical protein